MTIPLQCPIGFEGDGIICLPDGDLDGVIDKEVSESVCLYMSYPKTVRITVQRHLIVVKKMLIKISMEMLVMMMLTMME